MKRKNNLTVVEIVERQMPWSLRTFGPGARTKGITDHMRKEIDEILADPADVMEYVDVVLLALDGAWRAGYTPQQIHDCLVAKQDVNFSRKWQPHDGSDAAVEHVREPVFSTVRTCRTRCDKPNIVNMPRPVGPEKRALHLTKSAARRNTGCQCESCIDRRERGGPLCS